jgi:CRP-like cAMP-binding protein
MSGESLIGYLSTITNLSSDFIQAVTNGLHEEQYQPHQIIHAAGQIEHRLWFLERGFTRSYYFDRTGKEHTLSFYSEKEIIFSHKGFWKEATDYYLEVLEHSTLSSLSYERLHHLIEQYAETKILIGVFTRNQFNQELFKTRLLTWNAEERYLQFRKATPEIFRKASVRLIASYLNMTRENLSRLMARDL